MSINNLTPIVQSLQLSSSWVDVYTVADNFSLTYLDKVTVNNHSDNNQTYSVRIVPKDETPDDKHEVITDKKVKSKRADLAPELSVHSLETGTRLQFKSSASSSLTLRITATNIGLN